jgi:hypothetical protein
MMIMMMMMMMIIIIIVVVVIINIIIIIIIIIICVMDRLCSLMVRAPGYRSRGPGSIPGVITFSEK